MISKVLEDLEERTLVGSDVACSLRKTITSSSLGPEVSRKLVTLIVNSFHGYTHNWACQLQNHPNITEGAGLEDFETMERQFSGSNNLAPITRFASAYRRALFFEAYCRQWDEDRNLSLGNFLLQNVKQALKSITEDTEALKQAKRTLGFTDADLDQFNAEEVDFFAHVGREDPFDPREVMYVEFLEQLPEMAAKRARKTTAFIACEPGTADYSAEVQKTNAREAEARGAIIKYDSLVSDIIQLEVALSISPAERWTFAHERYQAIAKYLKERKVQKVIEQLQDVVIKCIMELQQMNLARTGKYY